MENTNYNQNRKSKTANVMESNEEDASNEMDISGNQRQMDDGFKDRLLTLGKMEQRTAQAFYSKIIEIRYLNSKYSHKWQHIVPDI